MIKRIIKIVIYLLSGILVVFISLSAADRLFYHIAQKGHVKFSKQIDNVIATQFGDSVYIKNFPTTCDYTFDDWKKLITFKDDGSKLHFHIFKYYLRREVGVWQTSPSFGVSKDTGNSCRESDNILQGSFSCDVVQLKGMKIFVFARKNYWVEMYWQEASQPKTERIAGFALALEKELLDN